MGRLAVSERLSGTCSPPKRAVCTHLPEPHQRFHWTNSARFPARMNCGGRPSYRETHLSPSPTGCATSCPEGEREAAEQRCVRSFIKDCSHPARSAHHFLVESSCRVRNRQ